MRPSHVTAARPRPLRPLGNVVPALPETGRRTARARSTRRERGQAGGGLKAEPKGRVGNSGRGPGGYVAGSEAAGVTEAQVGEGVCPLTEAGLTSMLESCVEPGYWRGKEGGAQQGSTSSSSCPRGPRRKKRFAGFPTAGKRLSLRPAAVTPRFSGLCAGAPYTGGARVGDVAGGANQRVHFWVARAPFCEEEYKWALGPDSRPVGSVLWGLVVPSVCRPFGTVSTREPTARGEARRGAELV